jgi:hypothetical protein
LSLRRSAMARKSGWQEFTENFNGVYGAFTKVGQDFETAKIMDDEKFTAEGGLGAGLEGSALEKARYKALGDIYTKYGNAKDGLAVRGQLADLEAKDRDNAINQGIMKELAYLRGQGAVRNLDAKSYASEGAGLNSRSSANDRTATLAARLLRMQADTDGVMSATEERNRLLQGKVDQQAATLAATKANTGLTNSQTDKNETLLPGQVAAQLADFNLKAAQTDRIEELLSGEKALQGQELRNAIAQMGLTEATANRIYARLPEELRAQKVTNDATEAATGGQVIANEINQGKLDAQELAAGYAAQEREFILKVNDADFRAANNIETEADAQAALLGLYKSSDIPIERQMAVETAMNTHGLGKLQNVAAQNAQAARNELQKGGVKGVIKWYDGVDDGDKTSLDTRVVNGVHELFRIAGTGESRTETVLHSGASEAELEAKLMGQITDPGSGLEIAASILEMRNKDSLVESRNAQTLFTVENTKGLAGGRALSDAQLELANMRAREIRAELRQKYTAEGKAELAQQADQAALDKFLTSNLPLLTLEEMDIDGIVQSFLSQRSKSSQQQITFDPID